MKDGAQVLSRSISNFAIFLLNSTSFQEVAKLLKLNHFFKKSYKTDPQNYHPISRLPLLSKFIERFVHDQKEEFLRKNKILFRFQSSFRKNCITDTCLGHLTDKLLPDSKKAFSLEWFNWFKKSVWPYWPPSFTKENGIFRLFQKRNYLV